MVENLVEGTLFVSDISGVSSVLTIGWGAGSYSGLMVEHPLFPDNGRQHFPFTLACPFPPLWGLGQLLLASLLLHAAHSQLMGGTFFLHRSSARTFMCSLYSATGFQPSLECPPVEFCL